MRIPVLLASLLTALLLASLSPASQALGSLVSDPYAGYESAGACRSTALPGTAELSKWLMRTYPVTGSSGTIRACGSGGPSEHKDGRAFDWTADVKNRAQKKAAYDFITLALATDSRGVTHSLARRMGIMYLIYDDKIYSSYRGFVPADYVHANCRKLPSLAKCNRTLRHLDHVHISLSRAGGAAQTSWYRARNTPNLPVLLPGGNALDPERTAVTAVTVPATGRNYRTPFSLKAGLTYRIVSTGLVRTNRGSAIADPNCTWSGNAFAPSPRGELGVHPVQPDGTSRDTMAARALATTTALLIDGRVRWDKPDRCSSTHTYSASYTPTSTGPITLRARDADGTRNPGEAFTIYFARKDITENSLRARFRAAPLALPNPVTKPGPRARSLTKETVTLDTRRRWGTRTKGGLVPGARYRVKVTGHATDAGTQFDASCYRYQGILQSRHTVDPRTPAADHFGLYVAGVQLRPRATHNAKLTCTARNNHAYTATFVAPVSGTASVRTWDPYDHADNRGSFTVTLIRIP